ncbi:hypothetical protein LJR234_002149 [Mesorhizobium amorphae]|uniref:hypothetical protein n=1 Tax=Mesorhizobium amorphae TaxID=71433 RepID=UPI003ED1170A
MPKEGEIRFVLDLEACLYHSNAGGNLKANLFLRAQDERVVISKEVFDQVKDFDKDLADEIIASEIEVLEIDGNVYAAAVSLTELILALGHPMNAAANEKMPQIALVHCAQNGTMPKCTMVSGDTGTHASSMKSLCETIGIPFIDVAGGI